MLVSVSKLLHTYLGNSGVLADKDKKDEAASEQVDTANDPEEKLKGGQTLNNVCMISMDKIVNTLKYPENAHHGEKFTIQYLK